MEIAIVVRFESPEFDICFWAELAKGLCNHQRGAWLEEQFERFGDEACALISDIMDECDRTSAGEQALIFEAWSQNGNCFETTISGGWILLDLHGKIRELLQLCAVQKLYMDDPEENE